MQTLTNETPKLLKDLKPGTWFALKPYEEAKESQVYIRSDYDRSERKYWATKWSDIGDGRFMKGTTKVYTDFTF